MHASARVRVAHHHGRDIAVERRAEAPVAIRPCGDWIMLASTAATPVGGDTTDLDIVIEPGARATIGSVAAMMVWPAPDGAASVWRTTCDVGAGAHLTLTPEPTVSVAASRHRSITRVRLGAGATCVVVEELALGRTGEPAGDIELSLRVERAGRAVFHHDERFGPGAPAGATSVSVGAARHVVSAVVVGRPTGTTRTIVEPHRAAGRLVIADDAFALLAVGPDRPAVRELLAELAPEFTAGAPR